MTQQHRADGPLDALARALTTGAIPTCPPWCREAHGTLAGEDDLVHVGATTLVGGVAVRLCATIEPGGALDGPYLLVGDLELGLEDAGDLAAVLCRLVTEGRAAEVTPPAARRATA